MFIWSSWFRKKRREFVAISLLLYMLSVICSAKNTFQVFKHFDENPNSSSETRFLFLYRDAHRFLRFFTVHKTVGSQVRGKLIVNCMIYQTVLHRLYFVNKTTYIIHLGKFNVIKMNLYILIAISISMRL